MTLYYPMPTWKPSTLTTYKNAIIADAPIGYWQLGEAAGTSPAVDVMGSYTGTYYTDPEAGYPTFGQGGINNVGGNTSIKSVAVAHYQAGGMYLPGESWSIGVEASYEAWIKTAETYGSRRRIISIQLGGVGNYVFVALEGEVLAYGDSGSSYGIIPKGAVSLCDDAWHHLVITKKNADKVYYYVDGGSVGNQPITAGCGSIGEAPWIGRTSLTVEVSHSAIEPFEGIIDELAIYDYALSGTQVTNHYNLGKY